MKSISGCFLTLGIKDDSSLDEVKKAYYKLARRYHPDSNVALSESDKLYYSERFNSINQAYNELVDYFMNSGENNDQETSPRQEYSNRYSDSDVAKAYYMKGLGFFRENDINNALDCFIAAHRKDETNAHYLRMIVKCLINKDRRLHEAKEYALKLLQVEDFNGENFYLLGNIYHKAGLDSSALSNFKKAKDLGFNNREIPVLIKSLESKNTFKRKILNIFSKK